MKTKPKHKPLTQKQRAEGRRKALVRQSTKGVLFLRDAMRDLNKKQRLVVRGVYRGRITHTDGVRRFGRIKPRRKKHLITLDMALETMALKERHGATKAI